MSKYNELWNYIGKMTEKALFLRLMKLIRLLVYQLTIHFLTIERADRVWMK